MLLTNIFKYGNNIISNVFEGWVKWFDLMALVYFL